MPCPYIVRLSDGSGIVFDPAAHDLVQYLVGNHPPNYPVPAVRDRKLELHELKFMYVRCFGKPDGYRY